MSTGDAAGNEVEVPGAITSALIDGEGQGEG